MSDFMLWLHANYIRPQIDAVEKDSYETHFHLVEKNLSPASRLNLEHVLKFTAIQAFLLGFRTSEGLTPLPLRLQSACYGAPAGAQRSGSGGERRSKGVNGGLAVRRGRS